MVGFKIHVESGVERAGSAGTHQSPSVEGRGSAATSPASVMSIEQLGLPRFPAGTGSSTWTAAAGNPQQPTQAGTLATQSPGTSGSRTASAPIRQSPASTGTAPATAGSMPTKSPGNAGAHLTDFATRLKPNDLASMQKKCNDIYTDGDGHSYVVIKDSVYRVWQTGAEPHLAYVLNPDTHKLTEVVLEHGKDGAWQLHKAHGLLAGGTTLGHLYHQTEAENRTLANEVYSEVKDAYRAGLKSDNKIYVRGDKMNASEQRASDATQALKIVRDQYMENIQTGKVVPPSDELYIPAANCGELSRIVAKRTAEHGGYAEVWKFDDADHAFAVIGHPPARTTTSFSNWKDAWIVDPWANIACPATQYTGKFVEKMKRWERAGKAIDNDKGWPLDPIWMKAVIDGKKERVEAPTLFNRNPWQAVPSAPTPSR